MNKTQRWRYLSLALFFLVFFLTPVTDLFRYDLYQHHFILLGKPLSLGLGREENLKLAPLPAKSRAVVYIDTNRTDQWESDENSLVAADLAIVDANGRTWTVQTDTQGVCRIPAEFQWPVAKLYLLTDTNAWHIVLYILLPFVALGIILATTARRWGRLYCGWLCPHYSVVEIINGLTRSASGKHTLWKKKPLPQQQSDGTAIEPNAWYWIPTVLAILLFSLLWAVGTLSYILPPAELYYNLLHFTLDGKELIAVVAITFILILDFAFARHLFCRYGCSVGILQSLFWMSNKQALVVGFDRTRVRECVSCDASCEIACPMELPPRGIKRKKFSCTQCMLCIEACDRVQAPKTQPSLLKMLDKGCALNESGHDFGKREGVTRDCF